MSSTINGHLMLEPYTGVRKLEAEVKKGFATVKAKSTLVGLKVLENAEILVAGQKYVINKNSVVYFSEETLATKEVYKTKYNLEGSKDEFVIGNYNDIILIGNDE